MGDVLVVSKGGSLLDGEPFSERHEEGKERGGRMRESSPAKPPPTSRSQGNAEGPPPEK